jgi:hypothetical protein
MRIGGWCRIGIVLSVLYAILVVVVAFDGRPRLDYKQSTWFSEAADAISEVLTKTESQEVRPLQVREALLKGTNSENATWLEKVATSPSENQKKFSAQVASVNEKHKAIFAALPVEQRTYWLLALAWWAGGVLLMFAMGWSIGWVYRGFRA